MKKYGLISVLVLGVAVIAAALWYLIASDSVAVLHPGGNIAAQQRDLIIVATLLMLIVVVPVFIMTFVFAWKFREGNTKATYRPDWDRNNKLEIAWWGIPFIIIAILSGLIWKSSHDLDPYRALDHTAKPVTVQVIALQWKWLFLYPEQNIASVNFVQFPVNTPVNFQITADAPMNSFWIPKLGGQVYAMAGMTTKLHLIADHTGDFNGVSANISGEGFADMKFTARASTEAEFASWVSDVKSQQGDLSTQTYAELMQPSRGNESAMYSNFADNLYDTVVMKYMMPPAVIAPNKHENQDEAHSHH